MKAIVITAMVLIFGLIVVGTFFYWDKVRPSQIKQECNKKAIENTSGGDISSKWYGFHYEECLREKGL